MKTKSFWPFNKEEGLVAYRTARIVLESTRFSHHINSGIPTAEALKPEDIERVFSQLDSLGMLGIRQVIELEEINHPDAPNEDDDIDLSDLDEFVGDYERDLQIRRMVEPQKVAIQILKKIQKFIEAVEYAERILCLSWEEMIQLSPPTYAAAVLESCERKHELIWEFCCKARLSDYRTGPVHIEYEILQESFAIFIGMRRDDFESLSYWQFKKQLLARRGIGSIEEIKAGLSIPEGEDIDRSIRTTMFDIMRSYLFKDKA